MNFLLSPFIQVLAEALLHFLWQGTLIGIVLILLLDLLKGTSPQLRYFVSFSALFFMGLSVLVTFLVLYQNVPTQAVPWQFPTGLTPAMPWQTILLTLFVLAWAVGVVFMLFRLLGAWLWIQYIIRFGTKVVTPSILSLLKTLSARLSIKKPPVLIESDKVSVPSLVGWIHPVILLPLSYSTRVSLETLEAVFTHELAHLRRYDYLLNFFQSFLEAFLFYHPFVWWVARRIREEREYCCDDIATSFLGDSLRYARALTEIESFRTDAKNLQIEVASTGGSLMFRIKRLLHRTPKASRSKFHIASALLLAGILSLGAFVACSTSIEETEKELAKEAIAISWLPENVQKWSPMFLEASEKHGVDPEMLAIFTLVESLGNPEALSKNGAMGLMQIMPGTAEKIATQRNVADHQDEDLLTPEYNIDFGAWYLAQQLQEFDVTDDLISRVELAAAAYNAGPTRVKAYLTEGTPLPEETVKYQKLITNLWKERKQTQSVSFEDWCNKNRCTGLIDKE